ncbi:MAG: CinA family protein [Methylophilaceae bacterium]
MDELTHLATKLGVVLKKRGLTLALAESCTGGMIATAITSVAGSSAWFDRGFVTYSNASKIEMLGVSANTLETYGAVSTQTALEMANGTLNNSHAQIACSITGIAGPDGGTPEKPVGTVCFAWIGTNIALTSTTKKINGNRQLIRHQSAVIALTELLRLLNN